MPSLDPVQGMEEVVERQITRTELAVIALAGSEPVVLRGQRSGRGAEIHVLARSPNLSKSALFRHLTDRRRTLAAGHDGAVA